MFNQRHLHRFYKQGEIDVCLSCGKERASKLKSKTRKPLNQHAKTDTEECKVRIQAILRDIVIIRDKHCVYGTHPEATPCDETVMQCDHLVSRARPHLYHDTENVVLVCKKHHGWKSAFGNANKEIYDRRIQEVISKERWAALKDKEKLSPAPYSIKEWLEIEVKLVDELEKLLKIK